MEKATENYTIIFPEKSFWFRNNKETEFVSDHLHPEEIWHLKRYQKNKNVREIKKKNIWEAEDHLGRNIVLKTKDEGCQFEEVEKYTQF